MYDKKTSVAVMYVCMSTTPAVQMGIKNEMSTSDISRNLSLDGCGSSFFLCVSWVYIGLSQVSKRERDLHS